MVRRILLSACGCCALALLACSQEPDAEVVESEPVVEEPVPTAADSTEPESTATDASQSATTEDAIAGRTGEQPEMPELPGTQQGTPEETVSEPPRETVSSDADPSDMPEDAVPIDPILESVAGFYGGLESFKVTVELNIKATQADGSPMPLPARPPLVRELTIQRPNQFASRVEGGGAPVVVSDGETITAYLTDTDKFMEGAAPATFGGLADHDVGMMVAFAGSFQLIPFHLMGDNVRAELAEGVTEMEYVELEEIDQTPAHHIRFEQEPTDDAEGATWEMWIASEGNPLVLQTSIVQQTVPTPDGVVTISLVEKLRDWTLEPELAEDVFVAVVPDTAKPARDMADLFQPPPPLLGEAAPEVKLPLMGDAGELDLAAHKDTDVVILDFWATWCGPCRAGMPILAEVAEEYMDQGVVFYAVNLRETDEEIQTFLEDEGLALTVAKDAEGATANEFGVTGIPHSVVIGKNGVVQAVHIGFSPELGTTLRRELDALLDGHDIVDGLPESEATPDAEGASGEQPATEAPESTGEESVEAPINEGE